jgi:hypothetical protein
VTLPVGTVTNGGELTVTHPVRRVDLTNLSQVRREMARCYREVREGLLPSDEASRLVYMLGTIGKVITESTLEDRISALEEKHGDA